MTAEPVLPNDQFWVLFIGAFVPLAGYYINKVMPWKTETTKAIVQVVLTGIGGVVYTAIAGDVDGVGDFIQQAYTAVVSGLFAHKILWQPAGINVLLGANPPNKEVMPAPVERAAGGEPIGSGGL
jgi:hypothetical protein